MFVIKPLLFKVYNLIVIIVKLKKTFRKLFKQRKKKYAD